MVVTLRDVTAATVRSICSLEVADEQRAFVAPVAVSIAQAHFEPTSTFRAVYAGDVPVGFILWRLGDRAGSVYLWRFMIDRRHQNKGYGLAAIALACDELRAAGIDRIVTSVVRGPHGPLAFYLSAGFIEANATTHNGEWALYKVL